MNGFEELDGLFGTMWVIYSVVCWIFAGVWLIPYLVARHRKHRNMNVILVLSLCASVWPALWVNAGAWILLLWMSLFTSPQHIYIAGPAGRRGEKGDEGAPGKDADEIPLSKAGVLKPRS